MKTLKIYSWGTVAVMATVLIASCTKTFKDQLPQNNELNNSSRVQVFIATVNANRNVVLVDGKRVSRPTLVSGTSFPTAVYPSTNTGASFAIPGGVHAFTVMDTLAATTQKPLTFSTNMDVGKLYTIFVYDTITSPKQVTVETPIEIPDDNTSRLRFANFIHDANAVPAVDVFSKKRNENIFTNVGRTEVTAFIPYASVVTDTLLIRQTGTLTELASFVNFNPAINRNYTLVFRGSYRGTRAATIFANY